MSLHNRGLRYQRDQLNALASNAVLRNHLLDTILFFNTFSLLQRATGHVKPDDFTSAFESGIVVAVKRPPVLAVLLTSRRLVR